MATAVVHANPRRTVALASPTPSARPIPRRPRAPVFTSFFTDGRDVKCDASLSRGSMYGTAKRILDEMHPAARTPKIRIVVLGSGWGAASFVKHLDSALFGDEGDYELVIVSPRDYFVYTPLLPAVASGAVDADSITTRMVDIARGKGTFAKAAAVGIDVDRRIVTCERKGVQKFVVPSECEGAGECQIHEREHTYTFDIGYDILVGAVGAQTATFGIPGVAEHCISVRNADDSERLREKFARSLRLACVHDGPNNAEARRHMNVVVIGGGPTGVEIAAELQDMLDSGFESYCSLHGYAGPYWPSVTLVSYTDTLLPTFSKKASEYATERLADTGVVELLGKSAVSVQPEGVEIEDVRTGARTFIEASTVVFAGGVEAVGIAKDVAATFSERSGVFAKRGVVVDDFMRPSGGDGSVFWIGDSAATSVDAREQLPPTAQVARAQGEYVADLFNRCRVTVGPRAGAKTRDVGLSASAKSFVYESKGVMGYVGKNAAVVDFPSGDALTGVSAGILWKAYETVSQMTVANKMAVFKDFAKTAVEGYDIPEAKEDSDA